MDQEVTQEHLDQELLRFCTNDSSDPADLVVLKSGGYLAKGVLTEPGLDRAAALGVPLKELNILALGTTVVATGADGVRYHLIKGSEVRITFFGADKKRRRYFEVYAGKSFPILIVYAHRDHSFRTQRWPAALPLEPRYI